MVHKLGDLSDGAARGMSRGIGATRGSAGGINAVWGVGRGATTVSRVPATATEEE
jgi:hypothetical protein